MYDMTSWTGYNIITVVLLIIVIVNIGLLKIVQKKHNEDPNFVKKQREREAEYRRKMEEEKELEDIALSTTMADDDFDNT